MNKFRITRQKLTHFRWAGGFTLTELLIVMSILVIMATILIGILNPIALVGKAKDVTRKKDLDRIKKSFEEYFNDKGTYPIDVSSWNIKINCKSRVAEFGYLSPWPCDPDGEPYYIVVSDNGKSFRILTNLENKSDNAIPSDWYNQDSLYRVEGYTPEQINYGVSSSNVNWNEFSLSDICQGNCFQKPPSGIGCNSASGNSCSGTNCYRHNQCLSECQVSCCGRGCN
ncbi:MAG: type II secretion system protein [Candidatus Shapirobacteria bacterium]|nr:type II secretion system protein [Candidatus Shapirobacteria bacterium]